MIVLLAYGAVVVAIGVVVLVIVRRSRKAGEYDDLKLRSGWDSEKK